MKPYELSFKTLVIVLLISSSAAIIADCNYLTPRIPHFLTDLFSFVVNSVEAFSIIGLVALTSILHWKRRIVPTTIWLLTTFVISWNRPMSVQYGIGPSFNFDFVGLFSFLLLNWIDLLCVWLKNTAYFFGCGMCVWILLLGLKKILDRPKSSTG